MAAEVCMAVVGRVVGMVVDSMAAVGTGTDGMVGDN